MSVTPETKVDSLLDILNGNIQRKIEKGTTKLEEIPTINAPKNPASLWDCPWSIEIDPDKP